MYGTDSDLKWQKYMYGIFSGNLKPSYDFAILEQMFSLNLVGRRDIKNVF
jgi:hypothetical protein